MTRRYISTQKAQPCFARSVLFFFFNDTATTEIYTLSLHDALPILLGAHLCGDGEDGPDEHARRSEEHTSELQSRVDLVCRLLLEKKKKKSTSKSCCTRKEELFSVTRTKPTK